MKGEPMPDGGLSSNARSGSPNHRDDARDPVQMPQRDAGHERMPDICCGPAQAEDSTVDVARTAIAGRVFEWAAAALRSRTKVSAR